MMWQTQTTIEYPFALRPASIEEAGLFYSQMDEAEDAVLGTVGHIRMDFGASGKEFYHTWWPHNGDQFNTGEFKDELQKFVDMLRSDGPLTNLASMRNYCYQHGGKITEDGRCFGYIAETEHYRYCLRCTPSPGDIRGTFIPTTCVSNGWPNRQSLWVGLPTPVVKNRPSQIPRNTWTPFGRNFSIKPPQAFAMKR